MYLAFTCMPDKSHRRRLRSLLCLCDVFRVLINSLCVDFSPAYMTVPPFHLGSHIPSSGVDQVCAVFSFVQRRAWMPMLGNPFTWEPLHCPGL